MTKDTSYYLSRLEEQANAYYAKNMNGKSDEEFLEAYEAFADHHSWQALSARIGVHLNEALAIIRLLLDDPEPEDPAKTYDVLWIDRLSNLDGKGKLMQSKLTRTEMLDRLHWISSEEFGEDLDEWVSWMAAFEADPPAWGHR